MDKHTKEKFLFLVNTPGIADRLSEYADYRIVVLKESFLYAKSMEEVAGLQKAIEELKRLKTLKDEVNVGE